MFERHEYENFDVVSMWAVTECKPTKPNVEFHGSH